MNGVSKVYSVALQQSSHHTMTVSVYALIIYDSVSVFVFILLICSILQVQLIPKRQMRVLSLFSGLLSGLTVLKRLKVQVDTFFSCEIMDTALRFQEARFPGEIIQLGDVKNLSEDKLCCLGRIDLLIGGAPCQGWGCFNGSENYSCKCTLSFNLSFFFTISRCKSPECQQKRIQRPLQQCIPNYGLC